MTKIGKTLSRGSLRTRNIALDSPKHGGAVGRINATEAVSSLEGEDFDGLFGRGKAKRDAKAAKKVRKAAAPTKRERKGSKRAAKDKLIEGKAEKKISQGKAKETKAEKGDGGGKVLETINKGIDTVSNIAGGKKGRETESEDTPQATDKKKGFSPTAWYMIVLYVAIVALILYFVFKK